LIDEKTRGRKSRDMAPFKLLLLYMYGNYNIILYYPLCVCIRIVLLNTKSHLDSGM
jgi:hypothetical protein